MVHFNSQNYITGKGHYKGISNFNKIKSPGGKNSQRKFPRYFIIIGLTFAGILIFSKTMFF